MGESEKPHVGSGTDEADCKHYFPIESLLHRIVMIMQHGSNQGIIPTCACEACISPPLRFYPKESEITGKKIMLCFRQASTVISHKEAPYPKISQ